MALPFALIPRLVDMPALIYVALCIDFVAIYLAERQVYYVKNLFNKKFYFFI
jgi:hypothetical protein